MLSKSEHVELRVPHSPGDMSSKIRTVGKTFRNYWTKVRKGKSGISGTDISGHLELLRVSDESDSQSAQTQSS